MNTKLKTLMHAVSLLKNEEEATQFFTDLCTPAELEAMADRWQVVPMVMAGTPYRLIHELTGVSVATTTRVARSINFGTGGYTLIANRQKKQD